MHRGGGDRFECHNISLKKYQFEKVRKRVGEWFEKVREWTTPEAVVFGKDFDMHGTDPGNPVETKTCLGDGTVPKYSLERFRHWIVDAEMSDSNVGSTHFDNVEHKEIVSNDDFLTKFVMVLSGLEKENAG